MKKLPLAVEGWPFILGGTAAFFLLALLHLSWAALTALAATAFVAWFFRDPERSIPPDDDLLVSPADGKVIEVLPRPDGGTKVGIFLSIFDVHVNRLPASGEIKEVKYKKGKFLAAWKTIASEANEQCGIVIGHRRGSVRIVQVAGLVARRIVCRLQPGDSIQRGERYGLIRFGSRVDSYLPPEVEVSVRVGDRVRGGADVIGRWR